MPRPGFAGVLATAPKQIRLLWATSLAPAVLLLLLLPVVASLRSLGAEQAAMVLDRLFPFCGVLLFTPLCRPEQNRAIKEVVCGKAVPHTGVLALRVALAALACLGCAAGLCGEMWLRGSQFPFLPYLLGGFATALFLGALGFAGALVSDNWIIGYLLPVCWYFLNIGAKPRTLGLFYLFGLVTEDYAGKVALGLSGVALLGAALAFGAVRARKRGNVF